MPRIRPLTGGGEAAPFNIVVGNTHPESTKDIIENVLVQISKDLKEENKTGEHLEILEIECLTKPREEGRRIWSRTWRKQVPNRFKDYLMQSDSIPVGWNSRRDFPPKAQRPPAAPLDLLSGQLPPKRTNLGDQFSK